MAKYSTTSNFPHVPASSIRLPAHILFLSSCIHSTMFLSCLLLLQEMCDEFQFLLCDRCHAEVSNPKLLPCLHNLCSQCREENKPIGLCIICGTPFSQSAKIPENQDNTFFANLHFKFNLYQKVTRNQHLVCDNCEIKAEFWCSTCEEFLCLACFRSHQRYLKKENHEARSLKDLRVESYKEFFSTIRRNNTMFCSKMGHSTQMISLYCRQCNQSMCTICALLDSEHMGQHCDISSEIQSRQEELQNTSMELKEKQDTYNKSYSSHEERMRKIEQSRNETRELIQQQIEKMIQILREKGEGYLAEVEAHHDQQVQDVKKNLQEIEGVFQRITSSQRLVEKMHLYASGQEVLEIQPFLATVHNGAETEAATYSRENQSEKLPRNQEQPSNFARKSDKRQSPSLKRKYIEMETNTECHLNIVKMEEIIEEEWNNPGTSYESTRGPCITGYQGGLKETSDDALLVANECSSELGNVTTSCILIFVEKHVQVHHFHPSTWTNGVSLFIAAGNSLHLAVLGEKGAIFDVKISYQENSRERVSVFGMDELLQYLSSLQFPILVGYKLWSMKISALLDALQKIDKEQQFEASMLGFLDALSLIREKFPDVSKYTLKKVHRKYMGGELDDTSANGCVRILSDLCTSSEINKEFLRMPLIACSSFRCFSSLQPLLRERVLSLPSVQTLALHNISLDKLQFTYKCDPEKGLEKLCRLLNASCPMYGHSRACCLLSGLLQCSLHGAGLEDHLEASTCPECSGAGCDGRIPILPCCTPPA
uniref:B box-type domain-containing protein n=1 Tax=Naja naja TaxID=35670 RepID=A0A8C6XXZ0_NAJNA